MKEQLKHKAAYLPYDCYGYTANGRRVKLKVSNINYVEKLELTPLSDLTYEDVEKLNDKYDVQTGGHAYMFRDWDGSENPLEWRYDDIQYLLSKHYDLLGLIEKGLAIDINTIEL